MLQRDRETQEAIEEVEVRSLELQAQRARMEQELSRRNDLMMYKMRARHEIEKDNESGFDYFTNVHVVCVCE